MEKSGNEKKVETKKGKKVEMKKRRNHFFFSFFFFTSFSFSLFSHFSSPLFFPSHFFLFFIYIYFFHFHLFFHFPLHALGFRIIECTNHKKNTLIYFNPQNSSPIINAVNGKISMTSQRSKLESCCCRLGVDSRFAAPNAY